jgi:hypothetical protein
MVLILYWVLTFHGDITRSKAIGIPIFTDLQDYCLPFRKMPSEPVWARKGSLTIMGTLRLLLLKAKNPHLGLQISCE